MSTAQRTESRTSLWRRMSAGLSRSNISRLLRSFRSMITCGKSSDVVNSSIYVGPKITVPWTGEQFQYPEDRYLSNAELRSQLNLLEMRFHAQTCRLDESKNSERRTIKMARAAEESTEQFTRMEIIVKALQESRKVDNEGRETELK